MAKLIKPSIYHRTLNGIELVKRREAAGLTQAEFAGRCGWSQQFQSQIEAPKEHEVCVDVANKIIQVITC